MTLYKDEKYIVSQNENGMFFICEKYKNGKCRILYFEPLDKFTEEEAEEYAKTWLDMFYFYIRQKKQELRDSIDNFFMDYKKNRPIKPNPVIQKTIEKCIPKKPVRSVIEKDKCVWIDNMPECDITQNGKECECLDFVNSKDYIYQCPNCEGAIEKYSSPCACQFCLQALDWEDVEVE